MKSIIRVVLLVGIVRCRNLSNREDDQKIVFGEGFNPGQSNSQSGSGYNSGDQESGSGSGYNSGNQQSGSGSGYNGGNQQSDSGSGYNGGNQQSGSGSGFNSGDQRPDFNPQIPDFIPDESITNSGNSGFNPGRDLVLPLGSKRPDSRPDPSGRPNAHPDTNSGFNPGFSHFRTPIVFAEDEDVQSEEEEEEEPEVFLVQQYPGFFPLIQSLPAGLVSASTLPAAVKAPYVPGGNKQQYLRGDQRTFNPFIQTPGGLVEVQTLPAQVVFAGEKEPYVPGSNKQQYLRGQAGPQYLPGQIVFATPEKAPYVPGTNKQQYLRGRQTKPFTGSQYRPLIQVQPADSAVPAQTLPGGLVFAGEERAPYVPGSNKQQYLRNNPTTAQTLPSPIVFASEDDLDDYVLLTPKRTTRPAVSAQTFRAGQESGQSAPFPGVSSRPSFPPGFRPRQFSTYSQAASDDQGYNGPKNVLYFFK